MPSSNVYGKLQGVQDFPKSFVSSLLLAVPIPMPILLRIFCLNQAGRCKSMGYIYLLHCGGYSTFIVLVSCVMRQGGIAVLVVALFYAPSPPVHYHRGLVLDNAIRTLMGTNKKFQELFYLVVAFRLLSSFQIPLCLANDTNTG